MNDPACERRIAAHPLAWADSLRAVAIMAVVLLHVSGPVVGAFPRLSASAWWTGHALDCMARASVPLFFMLSGALLLGRQEDLPVFFRKRLGKLLPPLVAWSAIYLAWDARFLAEPRPWWEYLAAPLHGAVHYHLWFLYEILRLYLFVPVLRVFVRHAKSSELDYFLLLWCLAALVYPAFRHETGFRISLLGLDTFAGYAGYLLLGYRLASLELTRRGLRYAGLLFAGGYLATLVLPWLATMESGRFDGRYYEYLTPNVAAMAAGGFYLLRAFGARLSGSQLIGRCAQASFGIYLAHVLILEVLSSGILGLRLDGLFIHPLLGIPLTATVVFLLSLAVVSLLQRIPVLGKIAP
ncbi:MAG: acyltransferase family protein [Gammaproteobacteria bacterium]|nr:acyltransferase family protein [Gammaproteobacteria bacterium]